MTVLPSFIRESSERESRSEAEAQIAEGKVFSMTLEYWHDDEPTGDAPGVFDLGPLGRKINEVAEITFVDLGYEINPPVEGHRLEWNTQGEYGGHCLTSDQIGRILDLLNESGARFRLIVEPGDPFAHH